MSKTFSNDRPFEDDLRKERDLAKVHTRKEQKRTRLQGVILLLTLVISNLLTGFLTHGLSNGFAQSNRISPFGQELVKEVSAGEYPIIEELPTVYKKIEWWTAWGPRSRERHDTNPQTDHVTEELWDGVLPSHGVISVDREWAQEQNWPNSMYLPKDPHGKEKVVYLLEAYHLIHCLKIMRQSYIEARAGLPLTWSPNHAMHCYDTMRQSIQCNADNTPLFTYGDSTAGNGQVRKCKSWDALRDFASKNSACFRDSTEKIPLRDHFGFCVGGKLSNGTDDGLP